MIKRLRQLFASSAKELTVCYRDPDVFIYSVLLPALIYPLLLFIGSEFLLWRSGATANLKVRIAIAQNDSPLLRECRARLKKENSFTEVEDADPQNLLRTGQVDAVVDTDESKQALQIFVRGSSASADDAKDKLESALEKWQHERLVKGLEEQKKDKKFLQAFSVEPKDLAPSIASAGATSGGATPLGSIRMVLCTMFCLACSSIAYGAMAPAVCLFTEEREKSTLPTTLLLPASRSVIIGSKLIATTIVALLSGMANLINLILVGLVLLAQTKMLATINVPVVLGEIFPPLSLIVLTGLLFGLALTISTFLATAAAGARDYSQAYNLLTVPLLWSALMPLMGSLPVVHHLDFMTWLPVANLAYQMTDVLNRDVRALNFFVAVFENIALIAICAFAIRHVIVSEKIFSGPAT